MLLPFAVQKYSPSLPWMQHITDTFLVSSQSVGTAVTLAAVGVYLHRRGIVVGEGKRILARLSQQVTFPLFLFTKIVYCKQDDSQRACPSVASSLRSVWFLLLWPLVVVGLGLLVGLLVIRLARTPTHQRHATLAAVAFGNSSGLPMTLLTVAYANGLGSADPTLFLSVYLLLYPVLQWGLGGWLLAPPESPLGVQDVESQSMLRLGKPSGDVEDTDDEHDYFVDAHHCLEENTVSDKDHDPRYQQLNDFVPFLPTLSERSLTQSLIQSFCHNVINNSISPVGDGKHRVGGTDSCRMTSLDESNYISELDLTVLGRDDIYQLAETSAHDPSGSSSSTAPLFQKYPSYTDEPKQVSMTGGASDGRRPDGDASNGCDRPVSRQQRYDAESVCSMILKILQRSLQPPVIASLLGIIVASIEPMRGVFVDLETRSSQAPLQWLFDGLYTVGLSAIPINMMILGCNISASRQSDTHYTAQDRIKAGLLPWKTMIWITIGKMILLPFLGTCFCFCLKSYFWKLPRDIESAVYLVMMVVFLTPTANNVMVIVELGRTDGAKEGIAQVIALQYAVAPIILSLTMTVATAIASSRY